MHVYICIFTYAYKYVYIHIYAQRSWRRATSGKRQLSARATSPPPTASSRFHMETFIMHELGSMKFTTQNDFY